MNEPPTSSIGAEVRFPLGERLLPLACLAAAALLFASELMTMFEFTPPGGEPRDITQTGAEQHGNAMFVISTFAIALVAISVLGGSRPAAIGVATMGMIALGFFLFGDLPDAGQRGTIDDAQQSFIDAEAEPQAGFWLEMVGALALAISGIALATLTPDQLDRVRPRRRRGPAASAPGTGEPASAEQANPGPSPDGNSSRTERVETAARQRR